MRLPTVVISNHSQANHETNQRRQRVCVCAPTPKPLVTQDGSCHRQISEFTRHDLLPRLATVASFRNLYSPRPYLSTRLHGNAGDVETNAPRRRRISRLAQWPADIDPRHCTRHVDGRVEIRAVGGNARLVLSALGSFFEVDFVTSPRPAAAAAASTGKPNRSGCAGHHSSRRGHRIWVTQRGLAACPPKAFVHPLALALRLSTSSASPGTMEEARERRVPAGAASDEDWRRDLRGGGGGELIPSELPQVEESGDHTR